MARILYLHQYFKTPSQPGGTRSYWIARELISRKHEVTMIAGNQNISKRKEVHEIDGIRVIYLRIPYDNSMGIIRRLWSFFNFMVASTVTAFNQKHVDLVIATSTPLTIGFPALVMNWIKRVPFLFEVRDLWPEVPIQMGGLRNSFLIKLARKFEKLLYEKAIHIVALSPGMKDGVVNTGIDSEKVSMIPNMAKIDKFWPRKVNSSFFDKYRINQNSFKVIHFGAMGQANGLEYIIEVAGLLQNDDINHINFLFLGDGAVKKQLEERAEDEGLENVFFLGKRPMDETSEIVNACDVSLVTFKNLPILTTNSPNKLFDSLSAGKPIIVNSNGWTKKMVEDYKCGFFVSPSNPKELKDLLLKICGDKDKLRMLGMNSRKLAENKYDKSILCKKFVDLIESFDTK